MREQLIREVEIVPLEVVVRNVAAGSLSQRLGIEEGTQLPRSIIEFYYKNDQLGDPMVSEEHITAFGWATPQEIDDMMALAIRVNDFLTGLFLGIGIRLVDFKMECGRLFENDMMRIIVADEISPELVPPVGHQVEREARQGSLPSRSRRSARSLHRSGKAPRHSDRERASGRLRSSAGEELIAMKARVTVTLKNGILDPQGKAIEGALKSLGVDGIASVRQGKVFDIELAVADKAKAEEALKAAADKLLANTVIENYRVEIV